MKLEGRGVDVTVGLVTAGPKRSPLYMPEIDDRDRWDVPVEDWVRRIDVDEQSRSYSR